MAWWLCPRSLRVHSACLLNAGSKLELKVCCCHQALGVYGYKHSTAVDTSMVHSGRLLELVLLCQRLLAQMSRSRRAGKSGRCKQAADVARTARTDPAQAARRATCTLNIHVEYPGRGLKSCTGWPILTASILNHVPCADSSAAVS